MGMSILCEGRQIWICQSSVRDDRYGYGSLLWGTNYRCPCA